MRHHGLDAVVIGANHHAYYLSGHWPFWQHYACFLLFADGKSVLIAAKTPESAVAADQVITYDAAWMSTNRPNQPELIITKVAQALQKEKANRIAIDASTISSQLAAMMDTRLISIDPNLWQLRRRKDADELAIMKQAIACTKAMYDRAREIIAPGIPELKVFGELHTAAVLAAGEPLTALGNDFASGVQGGPARKDRVAQPGELYILDLGPAVRGYFADNCRTFAVSGKPTDAQHKAWEMLLGVFPMVEKLARPGVRCRTIFSAVDDYFLTKTGKKFPHHLGHGVGLQPHEYPHLNPNWDDTLHEGEVFTCEPGIYSPDLGGGIRLENQYLVTKTGVENLTPFAMEMTLG